MQFFHNLQDELEKADAFLVVYSCIDKESFTRAKQILSRLQDMDLIRTRPIILVANKIDLARSRAVSAQGEYENCLFFLWSSNPRRIQVVNSWLATSRCNRNE